MSKIATQYLHFKKLCPNALLFYRLGGFYELYFDDAILAAQSLNIVLNYKKISSQKIPTCGFPVKSLAVFSNKLLLSGFKIAIAEQFIDPKNPQNITRKINKILTSGTVVDEEFLSNNDNILLAISKNKKRLDLCFGNVLLGNFYVDNIKAEQIDQYLRAINPAEILLDDKKIIDKQFHLKATVYQLDLEFQLDEESFGILAKYQNLALKKILSYVDFIYGDSAIWKHFKINQYQNPKYLKIDSKTINDLELKKVIQIVDKTNCQMGKRFLREAILKPLADVSQINDRLDGVEFFTKNIGILEKLQSDLKNLPDLEKIIGRIMFRKIASIDDLALILQALKLIAKMDEFLFWQENSQKLPIVFKDICRELFSSFDLVELLESAVFDSRIKAGFNFGLDYQKELQQEILDKINQLQIQYQNQSGIKNLKIEFSLMWGFYFEIKYRQVNKIEIPENWDVVQNLENSMRFSSQKLKNYQLENANLLLKIKAIEEKVLQDLTAQIISHYLKIKNSCKAVAKLDLLISFAILARQNAYVRPIVDEQNRIKIIDGRHFINEQFVVNDCVLDEKRIWLITGENMAGKSTFLRQNALIVLLAQAGCFVPVKAAKIGVIKQVFSKMMISDNLAENQSSFMVEMLRMAEILENADENSLLIIDELCQATNDIEGQKIAFAIIKYLLKHSKSLALITTHQPNLGFQCQDLKNIICKKIDKAHRMEGGIANYSSALEILNVAGFPKNFLINN